MINSQEDFKDKKIAVIGDGIEGKSSKKYLEKHGAIVEIRDINQGEDYLKELNNFDFIVRSPGVRIQELEKIVAREKITSQTKIFMDLCLGGIIGVTGTKGKGTTSTLIYEMLKEEGLITFLGGNIGTPPLDFLDDAKPNTWTILEMSSFQLADVTKSPHIAVMLMVTSEHLDYHSDTQEYVDAKRNILRFQEKSDFAIINRDYPASNESDIHSEGKIYFISREREVEEGCFALGNQINLRINGNDIPIIDTRELKLRGDHNHENVCAASLAAYLAGVRAGSISRVLKTFSGLEHRLELVSIVNNVEYFNDSFSTTPETAIAAIKSFKNPEILILGGSSKQSNFEELGQVIGESENIKAIIGVGEEWARIKEQIKNVRPETLILEGADSMEKIVLAASKLAEPGDVVLLSPACASFGMFKNYKDRGNQFKEEVGKLKELQN